MAIAQIEAGYENVIATCPTCSARAVYNRASDLGHFRPVANQRVACPVQACGATFDIGGDLINPGHEMLLHDCWGFFREKRYMQAVLSATTAYELFFAHFLRVQLVYRPNGSDATPIDDDVAWLNASAALLLARTQHQPFENMRRLFLRVAASPRPASRRAAEALIAGIAKRPQKVERAELEKLAEVGLKTLLLRVCDASIANLRNDVVHKRAYRPTRDEAEVAITAAYETIHALGRHFNILGDNYHLNEDPAEYCGDGDRTPT